MRTTITVVDWQLITVPNFELKNKNLNPTDKGGLIAAGYSPITATVPGNFELDLMREGIIPDLYFGTNVHIAKSLENLHLYYFTEFNFNAQPEKDAFLVFNGIDTAAEIYIDGKFLSFVENMHHAHKFSVNELKSGKHSIFVHVLPTSIYARQFDVPAMCFGLPYNHDSINVRKSPSMFGWDIMPRIVSGGIFKPVEIVYLPKTRIENAFTATRNLCENSASLVTTFDVITDADLMFDFSAEIVGKCGDSVFSKKLNLFNKHQRICFSVNDPLLWWPKNYGEQNLYEVEISLYYKGYLCDKVSYNFGIRTVFLRRSSSAGDDGDFCFIVNGKRIFCTGTNWVPTDAFPSRHSDYELRGLELANDCNCNMIRCWGGNTYPSDEFYNYCDKHGIMVWQDFAFGCGHYPDGTHLCELVAEEVKQIAIKLRNHPSLVLYAGDNECDIFVTISAEQEHQPIDTKEWINPNLNTITRSVILRALRNHDATRPYLPSSPYIDDFTFLHGLPSEDHIWGPRDYFKGEYYKNPPCHFASEIGYHGCPSPSSLKKFIPESSLNDMGDSTVCTNADWLAHSTAMETKPDDWYCYRIPLMISQVERIFGTASKNLDEFAMQSQISQAEAVKYFIEHFRSSKWRKTGLLWWNIIDGWPQVSDAVVDWYGVKKLAFYYIKRSQEPFTMIIKEPENGKMELIATNETRIDLEVEYTIKNLTDGRQVKSGKFTIESDNKSVIDSLSELDHAFYLIEWKTQLGTGKNHHACSLGDKWQFEKYIECMKKAGFFEEFSGF